MNKRDFYLAVAKVIKEEAEKSGHHFIGPYGKSDTPYDVRAFKGWRRLAEELKLPDPEIKKCDYCHQIIEDPYND